MSSSGRRAVLQRTVLWLCIAVLLVIAAFPLYWMLLSASLPVSGLFTRPPTFFPDLPHLVETVAKVFTETSLLRCSATRRPSQQARPCSAS